MSDFLPQAAAWTAGGVGLGLGARLIKHLADISRDRDVNSIAKIPSSVSSVAGVPVSVTPEEAAELERKGIKVKRQVKKAEGFVPGLAAGALGAGAAYGGWKVLDSVFDKKRKETSQKRLEKARKRVQALLDGTPEQQDIKIAAAMEAAEDFYFGKQADLTNTLLDSLGSAVAPVAPALGILGVMGGLAAYHRAKDSSKHERAAKALKKQYLGAKATPAQLSMEPVVYEEPAGSPASQAQEA